MFKVDFKRSVQKVVKIGYVGGGGRCVGVLLESRLRPSLGSNHFKNLICYAEIEGRIKGVKERRKQKEQERTMKRLVKGRGCK